MVLVPSERQDTERFDSLGEKIREANKYYRSLWVAIFTAAILFLILVVNYETDYTKEYWLVTLGTFIGLILLARWFLKRYRDLARSDQEIYAYRVYQIWKDIKNYTDEDLRRKTYRDKAKGKLNSLYIEINNDWASVKAPRSLWEPTRSFATSIKAKLIPTLDKGSKDDVLKIQTFMWNFATSFLGNFTPNTIKDLSDQIEAISIQQEKPAEDEEAMPRSKRIHDYPFIKFVWISIPFGIAAFYVLMYLGLREGEAMGYTISASIGLAVLIVSMFRKK